MIKRMAARPFSTAPTTWQSKEFRIRPRRQIHDRASSAGKYAACLRRSERKIKKGTFEAGSVYRYVLVKLTEFPAPDYWPGFVEFKLYARDYSELDKSELTALISKVKYMRQGNYTNESYANLRAAFDQAKKDFEEAGTKEMVDARLIKQTDTRKKVTPRLRGQ